jgi:arginine deiminase
LALREGVVVGYDRNEATRRAFEKIDFRCMEAVDMVRELRGCYGDGGGVGGMSERLEELVGSNVLILLPSAEVSRARGGSHCLAMPLLRECLDA